MERSKTELTLGARLATRYMPNQVLSSALSWGSLIGVEEVWKLEKCFMERNIMRGEEGPALTKAWFVHYIMEILENRVKTFSSTVTLEEMMHSDVHLLDDDMMPVYKEEVERWADSFAIRLGAHDPLKELCDTSNEGLARLENTFGISDSCVVDDVDGDEKKRKRGADKVPKLTRSCTNSFAPFSLGSTQRKRPLGHEIVRWSDLLTNLVRDYEHFHRLDDDRLSFARVRRAPTSRHGSPFSSSIGKDPAEKGWSRVTSHTHEIDSDATSGSEMHVQSADHILVSSLTGYIITSARDGIVKLWDCDTGVFKRNLYNAGTSWVIGMFLQPDEDYILIVTTNSQLTILDFPEGNILQKYLGCNSLRSALYDVVQLSATNVQRYGMRPGECGTYRVELRKGETAEEYHHRRREAQNAVLSKILPAKPVIGFTTPTSCWFDTYTGIFFFGSVNGSVGAFDISADVRPSALLAGANCKPVWPLFMIDVHAGPVVGIFYTSYATSLFTAGADGSLYRTPLGPAGKPTGETRPVGRELKPIRMMQWWPPSKYYVTIHVDRRVALWVIGRNSDPLHHFAPETQEVVSAALHPRQQRLALLLADKTIKVYETHSSRSLATIAQPVPDTNFSATDPLRQMMERSATDEDGVVAWHPYRFCLICCLRAAVIYAPTKNPLSDLKEESMLLTSEGGVGVSNSEAVDGDAAAAKVLSSRKPSSNVLDSRRFDTHNGGVVAMVVHRQSCDLHTFDENSWRVWELQTGAMKLHIDVSRAARKENISLRKVTVASCSWTTSAQTRLVTGGQDFSLLTWDPATAAPLVAEMLVQDITDRLDSDVFVISHRNRLIAWSARVCRIITFSSGVILPSGVEESESVVLRVPSLTSLTACCVLRDTYLCFGTGDATIFFYSFRGGAPIYEHALREKTEGEKGSVVQLIFLNEQNQNILLVFLDLGILYVYSYINQTVVHRVRLIRRFESRLRKVLYISEDGIVLIGDSTGRVSLLDVRGCSSVSVDFRNAFVMRSVFQGASDEITSLESLRIAGRRYVVVGSLDRHTRLFQLDDTSCSQTATSTPIVLRHTPTVTFVGAFGRDSWKLSDPSTFSDKVPAAQRLGAGSTANEEVLLESIINPDLSPESGRSITELLLEEDGARGKSRWNARAASPLLGSQSPRRVSGRPFFMTDVFSLQEENSLPSITPTLGESSRPLPQQLQGPPMPPLSLDAATVAGPRAGEHSTPSVVVPGRRAQTRPSVREVFSGPSSGLPSAEQTMGLQGTEQATTSPRGSLSTCQGTHSESSKMPTRMLWTMAQRLEAVMPKGCANGELTKWSNELLLNDEEWSLRQNRSLKIRLESEELRLALETRRRLADRMEEYKRRQALRRAEKKDFMPLVSAQHYLAPVVIPQPSIFKDDPRINHMLMFNTPATQVPQEPSMHLGDQM